MKKQLLLLWALIACTSLHAQTFTNYLRDGNYMFDDTFKLQLTDIFTTYKSQFGLGAYDAMVLQDEKYVNVNPSAIRKGSLQSTYKQYYKGYEVEGTCMNVASKCGIALMANGKLRTGLDIDVDDTISETDALDSAMQYVNPELWFAWTDTNYVNILQDMDTSFTGYPKGRLVIVKKFGSSYTDTVVNYALCWKFNLVWYDTTSTPMGTDTIELCKDIYVNALTGEIHTEYDSKTGAIGNLETTYEGYKTNAIETKCADGLCFTYKLTDLSRKIETLKYTTSYIPSTPIDQNNNWVESFNIPSATCHWATERAYDYFNLRHSNWSSNWTTIYENASATQSNDLAASQRFTTGGNNPVTYEKIWVRGDGYSRATLDVLGHEFAHGLIRRTNANIGYDHNFAESYAINEGLCDIFGLLSERYYRGWNDWTWGESLSNFKRNFNDPSNDIPYGHDDLYGIPGFYSDGVHDASGVIRRWFNHLSQGDWNWSPPYSGVGIETADDITYVTMMWWSWQTIDYPAMRNQTLAMAQHYWGKCTHEWRCVERAWNDVNVSVHTRRCPKIDLTSPTVINIGSIGDPVAFPRLHVGPNNAPTETPVRILSCNWLLPAAWHGRLNIDSTIYTLDSVDNFNSQMISVIVTYSDDDSTYTDTLTTVNHFSDECNDDLPQSRMAGQGATPGMTIVQNAGKDIAIFPNPVSRQLNLTMPAAAGGDLAIYNINGQEVFQARVSSGYNGLQLPVLASGMYIVRIKGEGINEVRKIQIQQ